MRFERTKRISEEIKKIVSELIMNEIKDPRIPPMTSITHVETTKDLRFVTLYVSLLTQADPREVLDGLNSAKGYIRKVIGHELNMRYTPEPLFKIDESIKDAVYLSSLINRVTKDDREREHGEPLETEAVKEEDEDNE